MTADNAVRAVLQGGISHGRMIFIHIAFSHGMRQRMSCE